MAKGIYKWLGLADGSELFLPAASGLGELSHPTAPAYTHTPAPPH